MNPDNFSNDTMTALIMFASAAWSPKIARLLMAHSFSPEDCDDRTSFYDSVDRDGQILMDTVLAIHERDDAVLKKNSEYLPAAWALVCDSVVRVDQPEEKTRMDVANKLEPLFKFLKPYFGE